MTMTMIIVMNTRSKTAIKVIAAVVSLLVAAGVMFAVLYNINTKPVASSTDPILFQIKEGEFQKEVLSNLEEQGIIKSSFFANIQAKVSGYGDTFQGNFELDKAWSTKEILEYLSDETNAAPDEVNIMLVEGSWAKDMAKKISQHTTASQEKLLELWNDKEYIARLMEYYEVLPVELLNNKDARVLLEGYLYPNTYTFNIEASEKEITELLVANADLQYQKYKDRIEKTGLTPYQLTTLASIVEYEASTEEDMRMVAGVFMNRLKQDIKLESSVTVCYALYDFKNWEDCESEQPDSPYNTYLNQGLPPGPILNPSIKAIEATLDYAEHDYIFFIADVHGDGKVHYQKTYEEHEVVRKELLGY